MFNPWQSNEHMNWIQDGYLNEHDYQGKLEIKY